MTIFSENCKNTTAFAINCCIQACTVVTRVSGGHSIESAVGTAIRAARQRNIVHSYTGFGFHFMSVLLAALCSPVHYVIYRGPSILAGFFSAASCEERSRLVECCKLSNSLCPVLQSV
jgi:hypothetical protein